MAIGGDGGNCVEFWMEVNDHDCPTSGLICRADGEDESISRNLDCFLEVGSVIRTLQLILFDSAAPPRRCPLLFRVVSHRRAAAVGDGDDDAVKIRS